MKSNKHRHNGLSVFLTAFIFSGMVALTATAGELPKVVSSAFSASYLPQGFDTNDKVQIVGEGIFPNSCFRKAGVRVSVNHTLKTIRVTPTAYQYDGLCMQMIVPFDTVVDVGLLKAGEYTVVQGYTGEKLGALNVRVSTNAGPDDHLYAPISQAFVSQVNDTVVVKIAGEFSDSCMELQDVITEVQANVIIIQPIALRHSDGRICSQAVIPFEKTLALNGVAKGKYLLHVRSLNGNAINNLVTIK